MLCNWIGLRACERTSKHKRSYGWFEKKIYQRQSSSAEACTELVATVLLVEINTIGRDGIGEMVDKGLKLS